MGEYIGMAAAMRELAKAEREEMYLLAEREVSQPPRRREK